MQKFFTAFIACALMGCSKSNPAITTHPADAVPEQLSAWGVVWSDGKNFKLNNATLPYDLNTPLFTDYALKLRSVWLPPGDAAVYHERDAFSFPVGTIISKTFHYEKADDWSPTESRVLRTSDEAKLDDSGGLNLDDYLLVETRLLVHYADGWQAFPYVWNAAQNEAWLEPAGDIKDLTLVDTAGASRFHYVVPDANQCEGCHAPDHTKAEITPIGLKARHLNRSYDYSENTVNQIEHWQNTGVLIDVGSEVPAAANWLNPGTATIDERARAYLDINCAHCHNSAGAADTSGLHLNSDAAVDRNFGICKSPTAAGQGSGDRPYDIYPGKPEESIVMYRMEHSDPAIAMPELGRSTVHIEGVSLIYHWIAGLEGDC